MLGLATLSDGFIYLALEKRVDFEPSVFPLLFVGTALVYMLLAVPAGRLADRVGRGRVFVGGLRAAGSASTACPDALGAAGGRSRSHSACSGVYYAATDGVLMAIGSALSPPARARHRRSPCSAPPRASRGWWRR